MAVVVSPDLMDVSARWNSSSRESPDAIGHNPIRNRKVNAIVVLILRLLLSVAKNGQHDTMNIEPT
jgi:hypothetical protein